jgi:hypothetical protein
MQRGISMAAELLRGPSDPDELVLQVESQVQAQPGQALVRFWLHDAAFLLRGSMVALDGHRWRLIGPLKLYSLDQRGAARVPLAAGAATLHWSTLKDGAPVVSSSPVDELSAEGVGLRGRLALPGEGRFPAMLEIEGDRISCLAEARYRTDGDETRFGVRLHTNAGRDRLISHYLAQRFPHLVRRSELDPERVFELLDRSGYLALREGAPVPDAEWFRRRDDRAVSHDVCYQASDGAVVGHVSFTRAYPRAWLGHQLATLRAHPDAVACRRDIYLHIASYPTIVDGYDAMMVGYYNRDKPWHQRFFSGFIEWLNAPSLAVASGLDRFERAVDDEPPPVRAPGVDVGPPRQEELLACAALARAQLPPLLSEVFDLHPERLTNPLLHESYHNTRFHRGRTAFVLRVGGRVAGLALCETGSRELSIFNLFNMAQVFVATGSAAPPLEAQLALLGQVRAFYRARGELHPIVVAPAGTCRAAEEPGSFLAECMGVIAWTGRGLRQYENFIKYHFGRLVDTSY